MNLLERINQHLRQLAPHQKERSGIVLLVEAAREIQAWQDAAYEWNCESPDELKERIFALP